MILAQKAVGVAQGRWGMYLLNSLLLPDSVMPFLPILLAVTGSVIGAVFFMRALAPERVCADYIAAPIAIACPVTYFAFYFTTLGYGVGVAFAVTSFGVFQLSRARWSSAVIAARVFLFWHRDLSSCFAIDSHHVWVVFNFLNR